MPLPSRDDIIYFSTKTWEHVVSTAFRQHSAVGHCKYVHGYALTIKATFAARQLDHRNWVVDFGSLKPFKQWLEEQFDHKLIIAEDDPDLWKVYNVGHEPVSADVTAVSATGCESIAWMCFNWLEHWLDDMLLSPRCWVHSLEVSEHAGNSAIVQRAHPPVIIRDVRDRNSSDQEDPFS
jgi:6-pyruvoyltetrahydropterin/6-carboxytetrahydropterin synthase